MPEKEGGKQPQASLVTSRQRGLFFILPLFFLHSGRARALSRAGADLLSAPLSGFPPVLSQPRRGAGPRSRPQRPGGKGWRQPSWLQGRHSPSVLDRLFPKLSSTIHRAQLAWPSEPAIVSLVTHLRQTPLEILDKVGSRDRFNFIPVAKHLVFVSWFPQAPSSLVGMAFC